MKKAKYIIAVVFLIAVCLPFKGFSQYHGVVHNRHRGHNGNGNNNGGSKGAIDSNVKLIIYLDNTSPMPVTLSQVLNSSTIKASLADASDGIPGTYTVKSFTFMSVQSKKTSSGFKYSEDATGNVLSNGMKKTISGLSKGKLIIISNITVTDPNNHDFKYPGSAVWRIKA